jgi:hypothetical protein
MRFGIGFTCLGNTGIWKCTIPITNRRTYDTNSEIFFSFKQLTLRNPWFQNTYSENTIYFGPRGGYNRHGLFRKNGIPLGKDLKILEAFSKGGLP